MRRFGIRGAAAAARDAGAAPVAGRPNGGGPGGPGLRCSRCGLVLERVALRCPRRLTPLALGCDGDCGACGKRNC